VFVSSLAFAQSRDEYNVQIVAAKAKVYATQQALEASQKAYDTALAAEVSLNSEIDQAGQNLQAAQYAYDQSLIPDASWQRPTVDVEITTETSTTVQVPYTETVTVTTEVSRQVTTVVPAGLIAKSYNMVGFNNRPPLPTENRLVSTQMVDNVDFDWGGGYVLNSGLHEDVIVNFSGTIYAPTTGVYTFYSPADDGTKLIINGNLVIDDWYDKGGGGSVVQVYLTAGSQSITLWYYENGGGANVWLYWAVPGFGMTIVPASAFGEQTVTTTVIDTVTTTEEVTTYVEEVIVTTESNTVTVPDESAIQPMIKDSSLLPAILSAQNILNGLIGKRNEYSSIIDLASKDVATKQEESRVAQQELEAIPPFREPTPTPSPSQSTTKEPAKPEPKPLPTPEQTETPKPEPKPELLEQEAVAEIQNLVNVNPKELTEAQTEQLVQAAMVVFETAEQGSEAYSQALEALAVAAVADDPQLPEELASIPGAAAVLETFNALGNVGADMAPQVREKAEETVIASVIAVGAAVSAVSAATSAASVSGGGATRKVN
jgi:hypothetical protein